MNKMQIAIDGPASAGKSTISKILATDLKYIYVDTGAMYRAITFAVLENNIAPSNEIAISKLIPNLKIDFTPGDPVQKVFLNKKEITNEIRSIEVTANVSLISSYAVVRNEMTKLQRSIANNSGVVMDGRDIGTTVLPYADIKIFLIASVKERAMRRYQENKAKGMNDSLFDIEKAVKKRDHFDSTRKISPLKKADDAIEIDTTGLSISEVVYKIKKIIHKKETN